VEFPIVENNIGYLAVSNENIDAVRGYAIIEIPKTMNRFVVAFLRSESIR
jgi:polyphosphate kinase